MERAVRRQNRDSSNFLSPAKLSNRLNITNRDYYDHEQNSPNWQQ